jgi:hypothetical protein
MRRGDRNLLLLLRQLAVNVTLAEQLLQQT